MVGFLQDGTLSILSERWWPALKPLLHGLHCVKKWGKFVEGLYLVAMAERMDDVARVALIREGNALFNEGRIEEAKPKFIRAGYIDGIIRVADHYYYTLKKPAAALILYRHAGCTAKSEEIIETIVAVIRILLAEDGADEGSGRGEAQG